MSGPWSGLRDTGFVRHRGRKAHSRHDTRTSLAESENASVSSDRRAQRDLATTLNRIGLLLADTGRPGEVEAESRRVLAILCDLTEDHPTRTGFRSLPAQVHTNLGALLSEPGRPAEPEAESRAALVIARDLAGQNPTVTESRSQVAEAHNDLGVLFQADDQASG